MTEHLNAAARVLDLIRRVAAAADNRRSLDAWSDAFDVWKEASDADRCFEVARRLCLLREQLPIIARGMPGAARIRPSNYEPAIDKILSCLHTSLLYLHRAWGQTKGMLSPDVFAQMDWCVDALPADSVPWDREDAQALRNELGDLRETVLAGDHPAAVKSMLLSHLDAMIRAVDDFPITGSAAVGNALAQMWASASSDPATYAWSQRTPEGRKSAELLRKLKKYAIVLLIADKLLGAGLKVAERLEHRTDHPSMSIEIDDHASTTIVEAQRPTRPRQVRGQGIKKARSEPPPSEASE
ncbi:MAG: hypothetical protein ACREL3_07560 [Gemmatimonadales bacterium]